MSDPTPSLPPPCDWTRHALFLDFDGTLVPIVARPEDVHLSVETRDLLARLMVQTGGAIAVLSGRALADLERHLDGMPLALSGSHGLEVGLPGEHGAGSDAATPALDDAYDALKGLAADNNLLLERKPGAVALHYRNRPDCADACREAVEDIAARGGVRAMHGNMVSEATLPGIDKGRALRRFMERAPFKGRVPVMIGDDTTDEDAFRAAQDLGGFGLRIGGAESAAQYRAPRMEDALGWLAATLQDTGTTRRVDGS